MAGRQASATYDDAIRRNFSTDQAEDLALKADSIGFLTTLVFSAAGAGGVEGIASGARRKALIDRFRSDPNIKEIPPELVTRHWTNSIRAVTPAASRQCAFPARDGV